jgi:hypothetical protein
MWIHACRACGRGDQAHHEEYIDNGLLFRLKTGGLK